MQTVTADEARSTFTELLRHVRTEPIFIRDGNHDLAVLISPEDFNRDQRVRVETFERSRDVMVMELAASLAGKDMTIEQFVSDLLA